MKDFAYTDAQIAHLKRLFAGNDTGIEAIRNYLLQFDLTSAHKAFLMTLDDSDIALLTHLFNPLANANSGLQKVNDVWLSLSLGELPLDNAYLKIVSRAKVSAYIKERLANIRTPDMPSSFVLNDTFEKILTSKMEDRFDIVTDIEARRTLLLQVDFELVRAKMFIGKKEETVEETKARLSMDSSK